MVGNLLLHFNGGGNSPQNGISLYRAYHTLHRERHLSEEEALSCEISVKRVDLVLNAFLLASLCRSIAAAPPGVFSSPLLFSPHMSALDLVYVSGPQVLLKSLLFIFSSGGGCSEFQIIISAQSSMWAQNSDSCSHCCSFQTSPERWSLLLSHV